MLLSFFCLEIVKKFTIFLKLVANRKDRGGDLHTQPPAESSHPDQRFIAPSHPDAKIVNQDRLILEIILRFDRAGF